MEDESVTRVSKTCARCKVDKPISAFARAAKSKDGLQGYCRDCNAVYQQARNAGIARGERTERKSPQWSVAELNELAIKTANLCVQRGCVVNEEIGEHDYLTVPVWCSYFELDASVWKKVQRRMLQIGYPLSFEEFKGFYIGGQGDQYSTIIFLIKRLTSMTQTAFQKIEAVQHSGRWNETQPKLEDALSAWGGGVTLSTLPQLLEAVGLRPNKQFMQQLRLLPMGSQDVN